MKVKGLRGVDDVTIEQIREEIGQGAKFVYYQYCISIIVLSFRRSSSIYYIRPGESAVAKSLPYILLSLVAGWWGLPWGPIFTIQALVKNFGGGEDVTLTTQSQLLRAFDPQPNTNERVFAD